MGVERLWLWREAAGSSGKSLLGTVVVILATLLVIHLVVVYQRRKKLPPGPWPWPIVGNLFVLYGQPYKNLQKLAAKYGGLMYLQLGQQPCLVVSTAAAAKDLFKTHDAAFASRPKKLVHDIMTAGTYRSLPSTPYGQYWRQLRRVSSTYLFAPAVHASHESTRKGEIHNMMKMLVDEARNGTTIDLIRWLTVVTSNTMTMMFTNNRFFDIRDKNQEKRDYDVALRQIFDALGTEIISDYVPYLSFITKLQGWEPHLQELRQHTNSTIGKIIEVEKHKERAAHETVQDENYVPDFVDVLLKTPLDDGKPLPDADIASLLLSFLNAGTDSSATTVEWAMSELMANPDIRKQAQAELDDVVGQERLVQESDIPNLPLLQAIVKETYRLHPGGPLALRHESLQPCVVSGYEFPAHTQLILNIYALQRDPDEYENPDEFKPSRFVDHPELNPLSGHDSFQIIPFGAGRRMCPGYNLGNTMVSMLVATLLHSFDWSLPVGQSAESVDMAEFTSSLIGFRLNPLRLIAKPRSSAALYDGKL